MKAAADRARARGRGPAPAAPAAPTSGPPAPAAAAPPAATARPHARWRHLPELTASVLYPLVLMASGLNVLSTWMPNLLLALGAGPGVALGGNTVMMVVGLAAALPGARGCAERRFRAVGGAPARLAAARRGAAAGCARLCRSTTGPSGGRCGGGCRGEPLVSSVLNRATTSLPCLTQPPATFVVERVGRRTLLAAGGATIAASLAALAALLAVHLPAAAGAPPPPASVLPAALALLCINRVALSCTLQPLAATGATRGNWGAHCSQQSPRPTSACAPQHLLARLPPSTPTHPHAPPRTSILTTHDNPTTTSTSSTGRGAAA